MKYGLIVIPVLLLGFVSCKHDIPQPKSELVSQGEVDTTTEIPCDPNVVYFFRDIQPILDTYCGMPNQPGDGCHSAQQYADNLNVTSYANLMSSSKVRDGFNSDFWDAITNSDPADRMPPSNMPQLSAQQILLIQTWIQQGMNNYFCNECDTSNVLYSTEVKKIIDDACKGCHSGSNPSGGISLTSYQELQVIVNNQKLIPAIDRSGPHPMPPTNSLGECKISKIRIWVNNGAINN